MDRSRYICSHCRFLLHGREASLSSPHRRTYHRAFAPSHLNDSKHAKRWRRPLLTPSTQITRTSSSYFVSETSSKDSEYPLRWSSPNISQGQPTSEQPDLRDKLFHPFTESPSQELRKRAAFMKQHAHCPHPSHQRTRQLTAPVGYDLEARKSATLSEGSPPRHVDFECPDCGVPVYCCEEHYMDDYESHLEICDTLRAANEDDHDLRSGRYFSEFEFPGPQRAEEFLLNMSNWDTFLYTRDFPAMNDVRQVRHATRMLTYPITIASILHELSPYSIKQGGRLTPEGLRSFTGMFEAHKLKC